jgi:predicted O-methyltransferase YrrM
MDLNKMKHFYKQIEGWFNFQEIYSSMVNKFQDGAIFVEVGCWKGKSACYMAVEIANSNKGIDFYCVDGWWGTYQIFKSNTKRVKEYIKPLRMTSLEAAQTFEEQSIDFVFIDADHRYDNVKADIEVWYSKLKKGGVIAGHDYQEARPGVIQAVDEFCRNNKFVPQIEKRCWIIFND